MELLEYIPVRILEMILGGDRLADSDSELLVIQTSKNSACFYVTEILDSMVINQIIDQRSQLLRRVYADICDRLTTDNIQIDPPSLILPLLWNYWIPLAQSLVQQQNKIGRTFIQGLLGGQGTGKTTLGIVLNILFRHLGKTFLSISLDDLYKTYSDRQKLRDRRPELIWRGPPNTHDIDLGLEVFHQLRDRPITNPQAIAIPRFDKSLHNGAGDRVEPEVSYSADIVLFEGWFVGMRPLPISAFRNFVPPILSESDRAFALECNANLYNYLPLWEYIDSLIVLKPEDYQYSLQWRIEAEHKLINSGKTGMSDDEITQFVEYFWKAIHPELFLHPMLVGSSVNLAIEISRSHLPTKIYSP